MGHGTIRTCLWISLSGKSPRCLLPGAPSSYPLNSVCTVKFFTSWSRWLCRFCWVVFDGALAGAEFLTPRHTSTYSKRTASPSPKQENGKCVLRYNTGPFSTNLSDKEGYQGRGISLEYFSPKWQRTSTTTPNSIWKYKEQPLQHETENEVCATRASRYRLRNSVL